MADNITNNNRKAIAVVSIDTSSISFETQTINTELEFICQSYNRKLFNNLILNDMLSRKKIGLCFKG